MFWKYSQSKLKTRANIPDLESIDDNGEIIYAKDDKSKADQFQSYFGVYILKNRMVICLCLMKGNMKKLLTN